MNFNFRQGTQLAIEQDKLIEDYKNGKFPSKEVIEGLKNNVWVMTAEQLAPCNLVIRQYCLIDIFTKKPEHSYKIYNLLVKLSNTDVKNGIVFMEGYSYYNYTLNALNLWLSVFKDGLISYLISRIDKGFIDTSYKRGDLWYPAPVGDLRDVPLEAHLQVEHTPAYWHGSNLIMNINEGRIHYTIKANPIGFNTHLAVDDQFVPIVGGVPLGFTFYEGYDKKYKNKIEEYKDTFNWKRIKSIFK